MEEVILALDASSLINFGVKEALFFIIACGFIFVSVMIDFNTGVKKAKALGEKIHSKGFRDSIVKFSEYIKVLYFGIVVDCALTLLYRNIPVGVVLVCVAVCAIEFYSVVENLRAKKSSAAGVPDMLTKIIKASTKEEAFDLLEKLKSGKDKEE